jgi:hypothetical protein
MINSSSLAKVIRFSKDMTEAKMSEFLELIHDPDLKMQDIPKTLHVLKKAKTYLLPVLQERTWTLPEEQRPSTSKKKKKRVRAAQAKAPGPAGAAPAVESEPEVGALAACCLQANTLSARRIAP